jgi:hypothetical protein
VSDYWLFRYREALDKASSTVPHASSSAYLDLARHYWAMHKRLASCSAASDCKQSPATSHHE